MSGYIGTQPVPKATQTRQTFTATASQTSFATGGYQAGYLDVFLNGVKLVDGTDYTATNGSDVVLTTGAASGDTLEVVAYTAFTVADQAFTGDISIENLDVTGSFTSQGIDDNATSTAMTLDASGNLLVGKASAASQTTTVGHSIESDGRLYVTRSSGAPLQVSRLSTDGNIVSFYKDGSTVGSIGTVGGDLLVGTGDTHLRFNDGAPAIYTTNAAGTAIDADADLGASAARFKDLYLSGGVYLGGTGSANKLDDYEEGTFSPVLSGYTGVTGTLTGKYTKIGDMVYCEVYMYVTALTYSGNSRITGWPFLPSKTINNRPPHGTIGTGTGINVDPHLYYYGFYSQSDNIYLYNKNSGGALSGNNYQVGELGISVVYRTNS